MQRKYFSVSVILVALALVSCIAAPKKEFPGANGKMVYSITCEAGTDCAKEASKFCPEQHNVVPTTSGADDTSAKGAIGLTPVPGLGDTFVQRLAIECT